MEGVDEKQIKASTITPKTSSESERSFPGSPAQDALASRNPNAHKPSPHNPFRRRETQNTQDVEMAAEWQAFSAAEKPSGERQSLPFRPAESQQQQSSSRTPDEAPILRWADQNSPIDLTGFSGGYFTELQELQQGIINSPKSRGSDLEPHEAEVAEKVRKSSAEQLLIPNMGGVSTSKPDSHPALPPGEGSEPMSR